MRRCLPLVVVLALVVAGSAGAAGSKPRLVRVVKRDGAIAATLTYRTRAGLAYGPTLSVSRGGQLVLRHRLCPLDAPPTSACVWGRDPWLFAKGGRIAFRDVAPQTPDVVVNLWEGGAHCCEQTFVAVVGSAPAWIAHDWGNPGYRGERIGGRYYFVSGDDRFDYTFGCYACSWAPPQVWTIDTASRLVDVTRTLPSIVRANARRAWRTYRRDAPRDPQDRGLGVLAGWCGDEFLLGRGGRCETTLRKLLADGRLARVERPSGRRFVEVLNRDLARWGYEGA